MRKPPEGSRTSLKPQNAEHYDLEKMHHIVDSLDFLRGEAGKTGCEEVQIMVDAVFRSVLCTYYFLARCGFSTEGVDTIHDVH